MFIRWPVDLTYPRPSRPARCARSAGPEQQAELPADAWPCLFNALMRQRGGVLGSVEVLRERLGDGLPAEPHPLAYVGYTAAPTQLELTLGPARGGGFVHYFVAPRRIHVRTSAQAVELLVLEACGTHTIIRLVNVDASVLRQGVATRRCASGATGGH
jgi:hypothetical protein